jgi:hypothetical protein
VGAWGDDGSRGNLGVGVEIRTSIFPLASQDFGDYFWVGDNLQNDAFIQFGYEIVTPSHYCLYGESVGGHVTCLGSSDTIGNGDVRWSWEYWPNGKVNDFYYGLGAIGSAGPDGSWHLYQIWPNVKNGWNFVLDNQSVVSFNDFKVQESKDQAYFVAEEITNTPYASGSLGPVEFRNLSYFSLVYGWTQVKSLTAMSGCGILNPNCNIIVPYGVESLGPNDVVAGTGVETVSNGQLLWVANPTLILQVPSQVQVTVDGVIQEAGSIQLSMPIGVHNVSVPNFVQLDAGTRLRFISWAPGSQLITDPNIRIDIQSDERVEAIYVTQYKLILVSSIEIGSSAFNYTSWADWYDSGSTANFTASTPIIPMVFNGWYDETGNLVTTSQTGTIPMDGTHILEAQWQPNYEILGGGFIFIIVLLAVISKRHSKIRGE